MTGLICRSFHTRSSSSDFVSFCFFLIFITHHFSSGSRSVIFAHRYERMHRDERFFVSAKYYTIMPMFLFSFYLSHVNIRARTSKILPKITSTHHNDHNNASYENMYIRIILFCLLFSFSFRFLRMK